MGRRGRRVGQARDGDDDTRRRGGDDDKERRHHRRRHSKSRSPAGCTHTTDDERERRLSGVTGSVSVFTLG
jgi:hypothetical protein